MSEFVSVQTLSSEIQNLKAMLENFEKRSEQIGKNEANKLETSIEEIPQSLKK